MAQHGESNESKPAPPSWSSIPHKFQLSVVCSVRTVDFIQQAALQAYMFYQLKSFSPDADDSRISFEAGVLQGVFTAAQIFTGILWGRAMDSPSLGRKGVILISLMGQALSCVAVGFSRSFISAVIWRLLGGAVNATVPGARTVLSESTEKKYHSRTFLLLPLAWNMANILGPIFGGLASDPVSSYPGLFGPNSTFGGDDGVVWLSKFPYAAPNLFCALILLADALLVWMGMRETLQALQNTRDRGIELAENISYHVRKLVFGRFGYSQIGRQGEESGPDTADDEDLASSTPLTPITPKAPEELIAHSTPPFFEALTRNVVLLLVTVAILDFQMGGFTTLWTTFLSTARRTEAESKAISLPFRFTGGLGFSLPMIGISMSLLGLAGIAVQLTLYPRVNARFGLLKSTSWALLLFPIPYAIAPYLSLLVSAPFLLWMLLFVVAVLQIAARTFAVPGIVLLTNNASPSPAMLGTIHGMGAATSSAFRTIGPIVAGRWFGQGLERGIVGWAWWWLSLVSLFGFVPSLWAKDGK